MNKRISSRGIIIVDDYVYLMFRRKKQDNDLFKEYYTIPGGGKEYEETLEDTVIRELNEELSVDTKILEYIGFDETENSIAHYFSCEIIDGIPHLGGEEKERSNENNYYEIQKLKISEIDNIDVLGKEMIFKAYNKKYK